MTSYYPMLRPSVDQTSLNRLTTRISLENFPPQKKKEIRFCKLKNPKWKSFLICNDILTTTPKKMKQTFYFIFFFIPSFLHYITWFNPRDFHVERVTPPQSNKPKKKKGKNKIKIKSRLQSLQCAFMPCRFFPQWRNLIDIFDRHTFR